MGWGADQAKWREELGPLFSVVEDYEIPATFQDAYDSQDWFPIFNAWIKSEFSAENLNFLQAVDQFVAGGDGNLAEEILHTFVEAGDQQVNISAKLRGGIAQAFAAAPVPPPNVFDDAREEIVKLISSDSYPRFVAEAQTVHGSIEMAMPAQGRGRSGGVDHGGGQEAKAGDEPPPPLPADDDDALPPPPPPLPADPAAAYAAMHQAGADHAALAQPDEAADEQLWAAVDTWEATEDPAGGSYDEEEPADHEEQ